MADKSSVLANIMAKPKAVFQQSFESVSERVAPVAAATGLPPILFPLAAVAAGVLLVWKVLPKFFKKGRGSRPTTRR